MKSTIGLEKIDALKSELEAALLANTALDLKTPTEFSKMLKTLTAAEDVSKRLELLILSYGKKASALIAPLLRSRQPTFVVANRRRKCAVCSFNIEKGNLMLSVSPAGVCPLCTVLGIEAEIGYLETLTRQMMERFHLTV